MRGSSLERKRSRKVRRNGGREAHPAPRTIESGPEALFNKSQLMRVIDHCGMH